MSDANPPIDRRTLLRAGLAGLAGSVLASWDGSAAAPQRPVGTRRKALGIPGPWPGRVIEIAHPGSVGSIDVTRTPISRMVARGMCELTGQREPPDAWRVFFEPGDVVGIKVNPVGAPFAISSAALVLAVIDGLASAGVKPRDIIVFDRYRDQFVGAGYPAHLPAGVRWDAAAASYDPVQLGMDGYDPDVYREVDLVSSRQPLGNERARRSHLCLIVSQRVNKVINLPVLKDHAAAGVTLALKNMSHGFVNNVSRSHDTPGSNACGTFIPAIVSMPQIRSKVVLNILDGTVGVFDGGPTANQTTIWSNATLYFATDPVALDQVGWEVLDAKRRSQALPPVGETYEPLVAQRADPVAGLRQPHHITLAADVGLGICNRRRLLRRRITLAART